MTNPQQPEYYSDGIEPVRRSAPGELFFVVIEARPEPDSEDYGEAGGAFVTCWVDADDLRSAERRAVALIQEHGWRAHRFDSWEIVSRETYENREPTGDGEPDLCEMVDQAFADGEVCIFNMWPADAPDADSAEDGA